MDKRFINFTNHPSAKWEECQRKEALKYGEILDIPFPAVDAKGDEAYISKLADEYAERIIKLHPEAVLCQGEFTLAYQVIKRLVGYGVTVLTACSERMIKESGNKKEVIFVFSRFRKYENRV